MIKTTTPDSFVEMLRTGVPLVSFVETDHGRQVKSASAAFMKQAIEQHRPDDRHFMMHLIAMGAYDRYGQNRNGDAFTRDELKKAHTTFVDDAHFYREHLNTDPEKYGMGRVKASAYNPEMDWVELLVWGDREKAAAEYEMAKAGKEMSYSMSCRVKGDICSCCNNFARRTSDYCDHAKYAMNQFVPEFEKYAFVYNPNPRFFDISRVAKPADRIAHFLSYRFGDDFAKAAAFGDQVITGADWASASGLTDLSFLMADIETLDKAASEWRAFSRYGVADGFRGASLNDRQITKLRELRPGTVFGALAKRASMLNFPSFVAFCTGRPVADFDNDDYATAINRLNQGSIKEACARMADLAEEFEGCCCGEDEDPVDDILEEMDGGLSARVEGANPSFSMISLKAASLEAASWAEAYSVYKVAAFRDMKQIGSVSSRDVPVIALQS